MREIDVHLESELLVLMGLQPALFLDRAGGAKKHQMFLPSFLIGGFGGGRVMKPLYFDLERASEWDMIISCSILNILIEGGGIFQEQGRNTCR